MANNITPKLKAYVQTDSTGRVVSGTPVFRYSKPKSGTWREIPMYYRGSNPSTTTTTTTSGGGVTPTAWFAQIANSGPSSGWAWNACNGFGNSIVVYTSTQSITAGTYLYSDAALTTLIPYSGAAISINGLVYDVVNGQINPLGGNGQSCSGITTTTSTTQAPSYPFQALWSNTSQTDACNNGTYVTLFSNSQVLSNNVNVYLDSQLTQYAPYNYISSGGNAWNCMSGYLYNEQVCLPPSTSISAIGAFNAADACAGTGTNLTLYYSTSGAPLGNGKTLFYDAALTQPYTPGSLPSGNGTYLRMYFNAEEQVCSVNGNTIVAFGPCSGSITLDFTLTSNCDSSPGYNPAILLSGISGTIMGNVFASFPSQTAQQALNSIFTQGPGYFNSTPPIYNASTPGGWTVGQTYYVAAQDANNPANYAVRSVVITACP